MGRFGSGQSKQGSTRRTTELARRTAEKAEWRYARSAMTSLLRGPPRFILRDLRVEPCFVTDGTDLGRLPTCCPSWAGDRSAHVTRPKCEPLSSKDWQRWKAIDTSCNSPEQPSLKTAHRRCPPHPL